MDHRGEASHFLRPRPMVEVHSRIVERQPAIHAGLAFMLVDETGTPISQPCDIADHTLFSLVTIPAHVVSIVGSLLLFGLHALIIACVLITNGPPLEIRTLTHRLKRP